MVETAKILEHFSGSDLSDEFHRLVTDAGQELSPLQLNLAEIFYFAGAAQVFAFEDKAWKIAEHVGVDVDESAQLYAAVIHRLQTEILSRGQEKMVQTLLKIIRSLDK